ncbi:MAG TPA: cytochrome c [Verrucomicrobiae bacterium]|jgi:mono/diheme cytochrome c family protein|nr:cytochrome c [Verrucomicrobiae bacterium]
MRVSLEFKAAILGTISALASVGLAFATGNMFRPPPQPVPSAGVEALAIPPEGTPAHQGYTLFMMNCAHCHGNDARGDEGPDLHGITKSDARIASMIKNGIKGEMPKFGTKLSDTNVQALIAFVRTLND